MFLVNKVFVGTNPWFFKIKSDLLRCMGYKIGHNTRIVGPIICNGKLDVGDNCWIGANFVVRGNGSVHLGNSIDVGPDVAFLTGTHRVGNVTRRAGLGYNCEIYVGDGCWIGAKSTFVNHVFVGKSSVIAACACVCKDVPENVIVGGVPARIIKSLTDERID